MWLYGCMYQLLWMIVLFKIGTFLRACHAWLSACMYTTSDHTKGIPVSYGASDGTYPPMATIGIVADSLVQRRSDNITCCSH